MQVRFLAHFAPLLTVERPYTASRLTHDVATQKQAEADHLNHGFKSASLVSWLLNSGARQLAQAEKLAVDTLLMIAGDDVIVDSSQTEKFASDASADLISSRRYDGYRHEILNETAERSEIAFKDIEQWLLARFA